MPSPLVAWRSPRPSAVPAVAAAAGGSAMSPWLTSGPGHPRDAEGRR